MIKISNEIIETNGLLHISCRYQTEYETLHKVRIYILVLEDRYNPNNWDACLSKRLVKLDSQEQNRLIEKQKLRTQPPCQCSMA